MTRRGGRPAGARCSTATVAACTPCAARPAPNAAICTPAPTPTPRQRRHTPATQLGCPRGCVQLAGSVRARDVVTPATLGASTRWTAASRLERGPACPAGCPAPAPLDAAIHYPLRQRRCQPGRAAPRISSSSSGPAFDSHHGQALSRASRSRAGQGLSRAALPAKARRKARRSARLLSSGHREVGEVDALQGQLREQREPPELHSGSATVLWRKHTRGRNASWIPSHVPRGGGSPRAASRFERFRFIDTCITPTSASRFLFNTLLKEGAPKAHSCALLAAGINPYAPPSKSPTQAGRGVCYEPGGG